MGYLIGFGVGAVLGGLALLLTLIFRKKLHPWVTYLLAVTGGLIAVGCGVTTLCLGFFCHG